MDELDDLARLGRAADGGHTVAELAEAKGRSRDWVRLQLRRAKQLGRLKVGFGQRESILGTMRTVPVYLFLPAKKKA